MHPLIKLLLDLDEPLMADFLAFRELPNDAKIGIPEVDLAWIQGHPEQGIPRHPVVAIDPEDGVPDWFPR